MKGMNIFKKYHGLLVNDGAGTRIYGFDSRVFHTEMPAIDVITGGCFGYMHQGSMLIRDDNNRPMEVKAGFWFSTSSHFFIEMISHDYKFAVWQREGYHGNLQTGFVPYIGQLNYIDGCKDSILHAPIRKGEPCLNALYMPEGVNQTMHTHPSTRSGFIIIGGANCETPEELIPLETGDIFFLQTDAKHKFRTDHQEACIMKLVAYHPDSDFGPEDENHPMINRTIVDGVSASLINEIRTK